MKTLAISQRPLLIGVMLQRARRRLAVRRLWRRRLDRWSRVAFHLALLAICGFLLGCALGCGWIKIQKLLDLLP